MVRRFRFVRGRFSLRRNGLGAVLAVALALGQGMPAHAQKPAAVAAAIATDARLGGDESRTRLIVDLSHDIKVSAFTLADPYRVVIDLPQIAFQFPGNAGQVGRGLIKAYRYGLVMQGGSRIVIDTTGPVRVEQATVQEAKDGEPARLLVDLVSIDRASFLRNLALDQRNRPSEPRRPPAEVAKTDARPVVVIDPGHGGIDNGTTAAEGVAEKTIVLDFAREFAERLEKTGRYNVVMTRSDDTFISLGDRVKVARQHKAALFISIHADSLANRDPDTRGATIYTVSDKASDAEAARLAEAENRADVIAGVDLSKDDDDVADILIDLMQRETRTFSSHFARIVAGALRPAVKLHRQPLRSAGFKVLKAHDVPSVLIELGYVTSPQDLKLMLSEAWRKRATESLTAAVTTFFSGRAANASN
nr:N-acetylmuramoyl-L-alanine amidase [Variibacter gotjawalensis]